MASRVDAPPRGQYGPASRESSRGGRHGPREGQSMSAWRVLIVAAVLAGPSRTEAKARAPQTYPLAEAVQPGDCFRVRLDMSLDGEMTVQRGDKPAKLPLKAAAAHEYPERVLSVGKDGVPDKAARVYETARATITVARHSAHPPLRD